jgi:hypothetical protein
VAALVRFDTTPPADPWSVPRVDRAAVLAGLARALVAARQEELLAQVIAHAFEIPASYPLVEAHVAAWEQLEPWLAKHVKQPSPALRNWLAACLAQLEHRTAAEPQAPADWRRDAPVPCNCADCAELKQFLGDPAAPAHRFPVAQQRRNHLASAVRQHQLDLDLRTEERGRPYTLICTKNNASFRARLALYHEDLERLARLRRIGERLPARGRPRA